VRKIHGLVLVAAVTLLTGCAAQYALDGQKYANKEDFHAAADTRVAQVLQGVQPLPKPLTDRSLVFALPGSNVIVQSAKARFVTMEKKQPVGIANEILENVPAVNYKLGRVYGMAAAKRGIYKSVRIVDLDSMNSSIQPSASEDVVYYVEPELNSGQYFYASAKNGKQVFAFDKSQPGMGGKLNGFLEALQAQAVRD